MAKLARLALVPLTLAAAAAPAVAQAAETGQPVATQAATQSAAVLGSVGGMKLYPFAGSQFDPLSNSVNATVAGVPLNTTGVTQTFSDGLPVRDIPVYSGIMKANEEAQATGTAMMSADSDAAAAAPAS
jgi:hypothetical protein